MKATIVEGPRIEYDRASGKVTAFGVVARFEHTTPASASYNWSSGVWLDQSEVYNQDGSKKTQAELKSLLGAKVKALAAQKRAEWDALDVATVPEREDLATWKGQAVALS